MTTVHFTGEFYSGFDGQTPITLSAPGHYQVSEEKAAQLTADFPQEFARVLEGETVEPMQEAAQPAEKPAKKGK